MKKEQKKRIVIGISGASGIILAIEVLKRIQKEPQWESHVVITDGAKYTMEIETEFQLVDIEKLADQVYDNKNIGASIASGTFQSEGMIVIPCSMKTVAGIASGYSENLLLRAADVTLKEGRKLLLAVRESPFSQIHLANMLTLSKAGAIIMPPMLTYYHVPENLEDMNRQFACRILEKIGIHTEEFRRWERQDEGICY